MEERRIGVYVCNCGTNIAKVVDCDAVARLAAELPGVAVARSYKYMCSNPGQEMIVAGHRGARPRPGGRRRLQPAHARADLPQAPSQTAGSTPTSCEMANIREQCSWVHDDRARGDREGHGARRAAAVQRVALPRAAGAALGGHVPDTLVLGGGIAGLTAALELADAGSPVYLVERTGPPRRQPGPRRPDGALPRLGPRPAHRARSRASTEHANDRASCSTRRLKKLEGFVGNFTATVETIRRRRPRQTTSSTSAT